MVAGVAGAQEQAAPAQTEITLGASPEYRDLALQIDQLLKQRKFDDARAICQQRYDAATDDETRAMFLRGIGEVYKVQRSLQCIDIFKQVIDKFPNSKQVSWAKLGLAEAYIWKGAIMGRPEENFGLAMPLLEQFLKDYPTHERAGRALWGRGMVYDRLGNDAAALAEYQKAVDLYPTQKMTDLCLERVIALQQKAGRWDDAIASAKRYLQLYSKGAAAAQLSIGFSYAGKGDLATAIVEFDKVVSQYPESKEAPAALYQKALSQKALGQLGAARQTLQGLVQTYPDSYSATQAKQQLELMATQ
jgi:TolA-binding protein